jgi:Tfp pilus assembly protein PilF
MPMAPAPVIVPPHPDARDNQIKSLQEQLARMQNDRAVLEAKLREALAARPAAVDPHELARADEHIRLLEKEKEVLRVSLQKASTQLTQSNGNASAEAKKSLAAANQKLAQQNEALAALRQEKELLERRVQEARRAEEDTLKNLRVENESLRKQLADKAPAGGASRGNEQTEKELVSTKAALQSSRDTVSSLQTRLRSLEEERDRLEKTRRELQAKLAAAPTPATPAAATSNANDLAQLKRVQKERDDLQKKLNDTVRQLAENKSQSKAVRSQQNDEELAALRARLETLEARKVPYSTEELALFKKPQEIESVKPPVAEEKPSPEPPASAGPLLAEAQRAYSARRFGEAEKKYLEALRLDDKNVSTLQRLASSQLEQSRPQDAEATLKRALEQNANDPRTLLLMGIAKFDQEKYDDALTNLSRSAQADPQNAETQNYLGITLSQKGQRAAAETALRKAIQLSPGYASAHYNLAVVYATQQPPFVELARWHYQKALAYGHPQSADLEKMLDKKQASQK